MKSNHVIEELSAYLDGEARHPEIIAEHLKACPECAERYEALRRLSTQVKALPVPEVRPEFVTRVVARAAEQRETARPWWTRFALPLVAMAGLAFVVSVVLYMNSMTAPLPPSTAHDPAISDRDALITRMAGIETMEDTDPVSTEDDEAIPAEDLLAALSEHEWFDSFAGTWEEDEDLDALIDSMDEAETQTFKELIQEYGREGAVS